MSFTSLQDIIIEAINEKIEDGQDFAFNFYGSNEDVHNIDFSQVKEDLILIIKDEGYTHIDSVELLNEARNALFDYSSSFEKDTFSASDFISKEQIKQGWNPSASPFSYCFR